MTRNRNEFIEYIENVMTSVFHFDKAQTTDFIISLLGRLVYSQVIFRFLSKDEMQSAAELTIHPRMTTLILNSARD